MEPVDRRAAVLRMKWELWTGLFLSSLKTGWMASALVSPAVTLQWPSRSPVCRHIQGVLPSRSPLAPPRALSADSCLPLPTSEQLSSGLPPAASRWRLPGETGAEHTELDGLSLSREEIGTDHHITVAAISVFAPSRDADNSLALFQIVISRIQQLTQSDALRKRAATKGFISGISLYQSLICLWQIPHVSLWLSNFWLSDANLLKQGKDWMVNESVI